ncbi:hypothetical protein I3843_01G200700 [Carya illinoinensis]|nr:hypothetical protein I3843_01G200700 [Carya illinoinensis]KAG7997210.1 hypothetical protein I3843_01G200700 [Carya illinoinensis]
MSKKLATRRELLDRWRGIEEEEEDDDGDHDSSKRRRLHHLKEQWFADAFNFLICFPKDTHIWCGSWDLMGPLLETFYNYFKDEHPDSPLKQLWKRISDEMRKCIQCISQYHQALEMYDREYELSCIIPLLDVLRTLDEQRVTQHLREINARIAREEYDPARDNAEVVSVMYEILMFPILLDDQSLFTEFETFIEAIDNKHELALDGQQQFPGVYALFFFKRRVRSVGHRLAGSMGKLRRVTDLEPLQPLLKKFIGFLETEVLSPTPETSRPRAKLDRVSIWLGIKSLLGFLDPPTFEEGILERYPIFLDLVLNHISGDSVVFSHAVTCLRLLFEMLGCKLWLRSTLSPSVMRNTLLGQCFHTQNEKSHKDIFDLIQPFLQSLEALQDGEHEKQRRHFIYFLLHQVPMSSNFSVLTRKKACQIALFIIQRGYKMNPPCPPSECAHMWGPSLVSSLKDSSLHSSLRQPAFDLIQTIIVSDAAALITSMLNCSTSWSIDKSLSLDLDDDDQYDRLPFIPDGREEDNSSWSEFSAQSKITCREYREWICIPMLWIDVLVELDPSVFPISFSKAVFWARSRFSMVEPEISAEMALPLRTWLQSSVEEISTSFGWTIPTGSDDGGEGKESKNSVKISSMCISLARTFNRLTGHFIDQVGQREIGKQWSWEPRMSESLILSLLDPNDNIRQFGKCILEQVSDTRGLSCGLKFLCSSGCSLSAIFQGFRHACKLVLLDSVLVKFQTLQHFFFVLRKLLKGVTQEWPESSSDHSSIASFSSQGGFLRQPFFDTLPVNANGYSSNVDLKLLEKFIFLLSETAWPSIRRCLIEGKAFIDYSFCQMTCVRLLEILPVVFEIMYPPLGTKHEDSRVMVKSSCDFSWLNDLMDWGKSSLKVVTVYWKRTVSMLLSFLRGSCSNSATITIGTIENLISSDNFATDELTETVSRLSVSLSKEASCDSGKTPYISRSLFPEFLSFERNSSVSNEQPPSVDDSEVQILDSVTGAHKTAEDILIVLSDSETEEPISANEVILSDTETGHLMLEDKTIDPGSKSHFDSTKKKVLDTNTSKDLLESFQQNDTTDGSVVASRDKSFDGLKGKGAPALLESEGLDAKRKGIRSIYDKTDSILSKNRVNLHVSSNEAVRSKNMTLNFNSAISKASDTVLKEMVHDTEDDPFESALNSARRQQSFIAKSSTSLPKRQVIQLKSHFEIRSGRLHRLEGVKRFRPPRLDDWYRPILEIDYFETVGLASAGKDRSCIVSKLKEVPVYFQSPEQYIEIFRPLVLEEFKAQLHSSFLEMSTLEEMYFGSLSVMLVERVDDFHLVRFVYDDNDSAASKSFSENDLVLLTKEPLQKSSHDIHMVGKVERRERDNKRRLTILVIRFYLQNGSSRLNQARRNLIERGKWHATRLMSITPQLREFQALSSIKEIPILPVILKPVNDSLGGDVSKEVDLGKLSQPLQQVLKSSFNDSQLQAIGVAVGSQSLKKDFELSLIQGPPGTGKTRTILAIVSGLLASPLQRMGNAKNFLDGTLKRNSMQCTNSRPRISQTAAIAKAWQDAALARQLNEDVERSSKSMENLARGRVLLCAQSNAAVDELVSRISSQGLYGSDGKIYKPYLVRVGNVKTVHPNSLPVFIDTLVDQRLVEERMKDCNEKNDSTVGSSITLRSNLEKIVDRIRFYETKRANLRDGNADLKNSLEADGNKGDDEKEVSDAEIELKLRKLYEQKKQIYKDLSSVQTQERKSNEEMKTLRRKLRKSILQEAEIVVTTLSGCGGDLYGVCSESMSTNKFGIPSEHTLFDAIVIDEAAQALEPATLIPLQLLKSSGTKCIMVGDPKQLPATVLSSVASKFQYECSMFERLQRAGHPVIMLTKQYRMHPEICQFPSLHFYDGKLLNGEKMSSKSAPFHEIEGLGPYVFYDIVDGQEHRGKNSGALSLYNEHEAEAAVEVLRLFKKRCPSEFIGGRIGIITPYKSQLSLLRSRFLSAFGSSVIDDMELNTVDGFQGREVDIILLSTVRAGDPNSALRIKSSNIGFVADVRRMNVALTRAKLSLWVLGNARTLMTNHNWAALLKDAKARNLVISVKMPYGSMFKTAFCRNDVPGISVNHSGQKKYVEKVYDASWHAKQTVRNTNQSFEREKRNVGCANQSKRIGIGDEKYLAATKDSSLVANGKNRTSEDVKRANSGKHARVGERKGKESSEKKVGLGNTDMSKRKHEFDKSNNHSNHSERELADGHKLSKSHVSKKLKKSSDGGRSEQGNQATQLTEVSFKERDANVRGKAPSQVGRAEDLIEKRKQREAVDAILCSSLISSKKSEMSMKPLPAKRSFSSSSNVSGGIKPHKTSKVPPASSTSASENQIHKHRSKK